MLHQIHVELIETKKKDEEKKASRKPFVFKETDFPSISSDKGKKVNISATEVNMKLKKKKEKKILMLVNFLSVTSSTPLEPDRDEWSFCDILKKSLCPQQTTPAWCEKCGKFTPTSQSKILQVQTQFRQCFTDYLNNPYCSNNWLPHTFELSLKDEKLDVEKVKADDKQGPLSTDTSLHRRYSLSAVVCYVNDQSSPDKRNLVAIIKVPEMYIKEKVEPCTDGGKWYLFNDFSICEVPAHEAVWFSLDWKVPCVLYYAAQGDVFNEDACIARSGGTSGITFTPLNDNEKLKSGDLVAMDAEFVTLNQEEAEVRSDGKLSTVKPSQMSVLELLASGGTDGKLEGTPFIDDYISTQEQVVDYLTKFSGIKPGDLDANFSSKHLTTLKSTYTKLRYLQDSGVIFVGHGLKNDFRSVLQKNLYKELEKDNKVGEALADLYETGKMLNWKVPED
nr:unnamed protein product [Callosobruchus analis]